MKRIRKTNDKIFTPEPLSLSLKNRADHYNITFKEMSKSAPLVATDRWIYGKWMMGNDYGNKNDYYGSYPSNYLERVMALFPDCDKILHIFSGTLDESVKGTRVDINPDLEPDITGDVEELSNIVGDEKYHLIIADPPYSKEDAEKYNCKMINRHKVLKECSKVLVDGGFVVWLDQIVPMYSKKMFEHIGAILIIVSTNHRVRASLIFRKRNKKREINKYFKK